MRDEADKTRSNDKLVQADKTFKLEEENSKAGYGGISLV